MSNTTVLRRAVDEWLSDSLDGYNPRRVRDKKVIRDALFGFNLFHQYEINLIDSPLLQRLRRIHQTSLASLVYPSANHSRFEHSLGVLAFTEKMLRSVNNKQEGAFSARDIAEARLAALLHDCGHGPFSHASEYVYDKMSPELQRLRGEHPNLFGEASGHEILSYLIVTSEAFKNLWNRICDLYSDGIERFPVVLREINWNHVGHMILGVPMQGCPRYLCQIINGPFDADKFDYILRDGYFSGLVTAVDIDRLAVSLDLYQAPGAHTSELCMDIAGATILEQLLFNKMLLFSSMYHHHKVRAAFRELVRLFMEARRLRLTWRGRDLSSAIGFLGLDDQDVVNFALQHRRLKDFGLAIQNRKLPKRILVIDRQTLVNASSRTAWADLGSDPEEILRMECEIASGAGVTRLDVVVDFPPEPGVYKTAKYSMIKRSSNTPLVPLEDLYPVGGWLSGYEQFRFRSYIFGPAGQEKPLMDSARDVFTREGIFIDWDTASRLAKWPTR